MSWKLCICTGNQDNITEAVHGLDIFTKNWCMNCAETEENNEPMFNCSRCVFEDNKTKRCLIKTFANDHDHDYPMDKFGSMSR